MNFEISPSPNMLDFPSPKHSVPLTAREDEILRLLDEGLLYKEIQDCLQISKSLINKLQRRIFKKLGAHNRAQAVNRWRQLRDYSTALPHNRNGNPNGEARDVVATEIAGL